MGVMVVIVGVVASSERLLGVLLQAQEKTSGYLTKLVGALMKGKF